MAKLSTKDLATTLRDNDLVSSIAKGEALVKAVFNAIGVSLIQGDEITIHGFGTFSVATRTGSSVLGGGKPKPWTAKTVKFSTSAPLKRGL